MKKTLVFAVALLLVASLAVAAGPKTYQVTGPVLEVRDDVIVVEKGKEKWEVAKGAAKVTGDLKAGAKVTVTYTMTATAVEVKGDKAPPKEKAPKK